MAMEPWSFWDSMMYALETMPIIGGSVMAARGVDSATNKVAVYLGAGQSITPSKAELDNAVNTISDGLSAVAAILTYGAVAVGLYYGYKVIKEIKS